MKIRIHSIETMGALDGPGIRTVIFFQGCPMRCAYCHNADTFPVKAGTVYDTDELAAFAGRYKAYYGNTGGVTLSGGEPLLQGNGAEELIDKLHAKGIKSAIDTSGYILHEGALLKADLILLDIKHTEPSAYKELTGQALDNTLKTLEFLKRNKKPFWIRQVIVKGITDSAENIEKLRKLSEGAERIELLPYHAMGVDKWEKQGLKYRLEGAEPPDKDTMEKLNAIINGDI